MRTREKMMVLAGLEVQPRQDGDSDLTKRQANYLQGFLAIRGFAPLDNDVLNVVSQEQASELLDQLETI
jgi:hypothetical protein